MPRPGIGAEHARDGHATRSRRTAPGCGPRPLGQHRVHLGLAVRAQPDQLRPVPDQLPRLTGGGRSDLRLERLDPRRVRQMRPCAGRLERVDRPVSAIGCLQHHRGLPGALITRSELSTSLRIRTPSSTSPSMLALPITLRRRCRSMPTDCCPAYSDIRAPFVVESSTPPASIGTAGGAEAPLLSSSHQRGDSTHCDHSRDPLNVSRDFFAQQAVPDRFGPDCVGGRA